MKKITILGFALVFFSLSATAGHRSSLMAVPLHFVVVDHFLFLPDVNLPKGIDQEQSTRLSVHHGKFSSVKKMSFRNRMALRIMSKKIRTQVARPGEDLSEADRMAKSSMTFGIIALVLAIPFYTVIAAIPLGIIAINKASKARRMGSTKKTGRTLGIVALVIAGLWILFVAWFVAVNAL